MVSVFIRGSLVPLVTPDEKRGTGAGGRVRVHRRVERAGRVRERHARSGLRHAGDRHRRWCGDAWRSSASGGSRSRRCATSTASRSSNVTRPGHTDASSTRRGVVDVAGQLAERASTDRIAALSTPVTNGVAAELTMFQIHRSLGPVHPVASDGEHQLLGIEPAERFRRQRGKRGGLIDHGNAVELLCAGQSRVHAPEPPGDRGVRSHCRP